MDISSSEWEVMRVIWSQGPLKSKVIIAQLSQKLGWSDSTVKTLLGRLVTKGSLMTQRDGRSFIYHAKLSERAAIDSQLDVLLDRVCQRKHVDLLRYLIETTTLSQSAFDIIQVDLERKRQVLVDEVVCQCWVGQCACQMACQQGESL